MASIFTDDERRVRYERLRKKKRMLDIMRVICFWGILVITLLALSSANSTIAGIVGMILAGLGMIAAYLRDARIAAGLIPVSIVAACLTGALPLTLPVLLDGLCIYFSTAWSKLSQEDGFPDFRISLSEYKQREELRGRSADERAVETGVRVAEIQTDSGMHDLLDAGRDAPAVAGKLQAYRERGQFAQPYETEQEDILPEMKEL